MRRAAPRFGAMIAALALTGMLAACGGSSSTGSSGSGADGAGTGSGSAAAGNTIADMVPAAVKDKGTLTVATDATYAPMEFMKGGKVEGVDADLAAALAEEMGLKANVVNATFDSIIPGLAAHKFDVGMSSFTDTKEREKVVDFVTYFSAGTSFIVKADGGPTINTLDDICGKRVALEKGTTQQDDATAQSKKCDVTVLTYPDQNGAYLAISSGRADLGMVDSPVAAYEVKRADGQFKVTGDSYGTAPFGIAIPKDSGLAEPMQAALKKLIADGKYQSILKKWGVEAGGITDPVINGAEG